MVYGVRKVRRQLGREDIRIARCTVARLMRGLGIAGAVRVKRRKLTTIPEDVRSTRLISWRATSRPCARTNSGARILPTSRAAWVCLRRVRHPRRIVGWRVSSLLRVISRSTRSRGDTFGAQ